MLITKIEQAIFVQHQVNCKKENYIFKKPKRDLIGKNKRKITKQNKYEINM